MTASQIGKALAKLRKPGTKPKLSPDERERRRTWMRSVNERRKAKAQNL